MPLYELEGARPTLGARVYIAPGAHVIGKVTIGDDSSIWFNTVLRGDEEPITIGARTSIQDGTVVHITQGLSQTVVGDDVTVGHSVILHGCRVGNRCLIGMGSVILDNAIVEDDAMVAAGALVPPGMVVPSGKLVMGRPAKVVRDLRDTDRLMITGGAISYVEYKNAFLKTCKVIDGT